jgi:phosphoglycolate phosphatase-like HAD superfamily hydrolase
MVGDSMYDILCAKNAGVKAALVIWRGVSDADKEAKTRRIISRESGRPTLEYIERK